jgi:hypothetical protein
MQGSTLFGGVLLRLLWRRKTCAESERWQAAQVLTALPEDSQL